ncbi:hypothetical protein LX83_006587 [Goodfellowiella coeruleoviolacea]|uniref:Uncharacterized protein n=2 Tax=Goodfellowiella coeruleoviolacea TaxID=334858 RepID=A0AAE3KIX4_9PSEU|nr:hypothetical protein [Goodfellowiella coeruleoviolacea]
MWMRGGDGFVHAFSAAEASKTEGIVRALGDCCYSGSAADLIRMPVGRFCLACSDGVKSAEDEGVLAAQKRDRGTPG